MLAAKEGQAQAQPRAQHEGEREGEGEGPSTKFASLPLRLSPKKAQSGPKARLEIGSPTASSHVFPSPTAAYAPPPPPSHPSTVLSPFRPRTSSSPNVHPALSLTLSARPPLPRAATVLATRFANSTNLKDRLVASAGIGKDWTKKSKVKLEDHWKASSLSEPSSPSASDRRRTPSPSLNPSLSPLGANDNPIKLPATILGVRVPKRSRVAFGVPLEVVVEETRIPVLDDDPYRKKDPDEVLGDEARRWLPAVAVRCLEYLEE